jgi:hypothetical protein
MYFSINKVLVPFHCTSSYHRSQMGYLNVDPHRSWRVDILVRVKCKLHGHMGFSLSDVKNIYTHVHVFICTSALCREWSFVKTY